MKPDAIIRITEEYGLKPFLQKEFIERLSEDEYAELDSGDREEPFFASRTIEDALTKFLTEKVGEGIQKWREEEPDMPEDKFAGSYAVKELERALENGFESIVDEFESGGGSQ